MGLSQNQDLPGSIIYNAPNDSIDPENRPCVASKIAFHPPNSWLEGE